jgi:2-hydroxychromene-2-carboxylate isomerase
MPVVDFWFDFASTYSYPAAMRADALAKAAGVTIRHRPFLLGPIFKAQGWDTSPFNIYEAKGRYMWRDLERLCADLGIAFRRPSPFPQNSLLAARVALAGEGESWRDEFCRAVFRAQFAEGRRAAAPDLRSRGVRSDQGAAARADRRGRAVRHLRRAEFHHAGRRIVLGQRPAGTRHRLGEKDRFAQRLKFARNRAAITRNRLPASGVYIKLAAGPLQPIFTPSRWPRCNNRGLFFRAVIAREGGRSSKSKNLNKYWMPRFRGA